MLDDAGYPNGDLFIEDGLHLNGKGYKLWENKLKEVSKIFPEKIKIKM
jgi:lysophospholipase L1-like esterase